MNQMRRAERLSREHFLATLRSGDNYGYYTKLQFKLHLAALIAKAPSELQDFLSASNVLSIVSLSRNAKLYSILCPMPLKPEKIQYVNQQLDEVIHTNRKFLEGVKKVLLASILIKEQPIFIKKLDFPFEGINFFPTSCPLSRASETDPLLEFYRKIAMIMIVEWTLSAVTKKTIFPGTPVGRPAYSSALISEFCNGVNYGCPVSSESDTQAFDLMLNVQTKVEICQFLGQGSLTLSRIVQLDSRQFVSMLDLENYIVLYGLYGLSGLGVDE